MAEEFGLCRYNDVSCGNFYGEAIGQPIFLFSVAILIISIILQFTRESTYLAWRRFAIWAVPIGAVILWLVPASSGGGLGISGPDLTKETASWLISILFLLVSLFIIIKRSLSGSTAQ